MFGLKSFASDTRGNVAMMFGLAVVAIFGISGLAIDYTRGTTVRAKVAAAADAAVLAGAKVEGTQAEREQAAQAVFNAAIGSIPGVSNITFSGTDVMSGGKITAFKVITSVKLETTIGKLFGQDKLPIGASSQASKGGTEKYEIAMVLDTTESMSGAKLAALKVAAKNLVTTLSAKATVADQVKFAVVPFSQWVNVGLANRNATWLDVAADYSETNMVDVTTYPNRVDTNCRTEPATGYNDGVPYTYDKTVCDTVLGDPVVTPTQKTYNYAWNGCVGSRNYPLNTNDSGYGNKVPGVMQSGGWNPCPNEILPLTADATAVNAAIDALTVDRDTYIPSGLVWGWRVLSPGAPYAESTKGSDPDVNQVLILMTDGANSRSSDYPDHWGGNVADANSKTSEICTNINSPATGIKVYTIAFEVTDATIKSILQACAGNDASRFFDAGNSAQLSAAFTKIANSLSKLRLEK